MAKAKAMKRFNHALKHDRPWIDQRRPSSKINELMTFIRYVIYKTFASANNGGKCATKPKPTTADDRPFEKLAAV